MWSHLKRDKKILLALGLVYLLLLAFLPRNPSWDDYYWVQWTEWLANEGLHRAYELKELNYMPFTLYLLYGFGKLLQATGTEIATSVFLFRPIVLLFDFGIIYLIIKLLQRFNLSLNRVLVILFNIAFLYNTLIWGQVDAILTFFLLAVIVLASFKKPVWAVVFYVLALNTKIQAIIFLPIVFLLLAPQFWQRRKDLLKAVTGGIVVQILLALPFILNNKVDGIIRTATEAVDFYPLISLNAMNFWVLLGGEGIMRLEDYNIPFLLSYKNWGLLLFCLFSALVLLPFLVRLSDWVKQKFVLKLADWQFLALVCSLIPLFFFYFNTQMHERYVHPAIIFAGIFAVLSGKYLYYGLLSLAYLLNMESLIKFWNFRNYDIFLFDERFMAFLFTIALILGVYYVYRAVKLNETFTFLRQISGLPRRLV